MYDIPLSTLKMNAKGLKELGLINNNPSVRLTAAGRQVFTILGDTNDTIRN